MNDRTQTFAATSSDGAALKEIRQQLGVFARCVDPNGSLGGDVETIAAEILDNIREHSSGESRVNVRVTHGTAALEIEFRDAGVAFDPLQAESPDLDVPLCERDIGGLGIHIACSLASELRYRRSSEGENVLTVRLSLSKGSGRRPGN